MALYRYFFAPVLLAVAALVGPSRPRSPSPPPPESAQLRAAPAAPRLEPARMGPRRDQGGAPRAFSDVR